MMVLRKPLRLISFWQLQALGWVCFYAWTLLGSLPDILKRSGALRENTEVVGLLFLGSCVLRPVCRWLLRRYPSWVAFELRAFVASVTIGAAVAFVFELTLKGIHNMNAVNLAVNSADFPFLLFSWSSLYFSIKQWNSASQERERLLRAEAEVREARLQALRYQLNPHFLFNSLNAGSGWPSFRGYQDVVANRGFPAHQPERPGRPGGASFRGDGVYRTVHRNRENPAGGPVASGVSHISRHAGCYGTGHVTSTAG
jgi:hypothetical protein